MTEIKKKALEAMIDREILDAKDSLGILVSSSFAIMRGDGYEVQVKVTTDTDEFLDEVDPEYEQAQE